MASPVDTSVKFYSSTMPGAPAVNGVAGSVTDMLDAVLVNGFGSKTATSLVVSGGIATLTFSGGASAAQPGSVILVAGATPSNLNGEQKVLTISSTTVTFATAEANTTATGTITFKIAPLGYTIEFTGTNVRAYKPIDVASSGCVLRAVDTDAVNVRVTGFRSMSDIDTGVGQFPNGSQMAGGLYWRKSVYADTVAVPWVLIGDSRGFYIAMSPYQHVSYNAAVRDHVVYFFGDIEPARSGDPYACLLTGSNEVTPTQFGNFAWPYLGNDIGAYLARSVTGLGSGVIVERIPYAISNSVEVSGRASTGYGPFPSIADYGLRLAEMLICENPRSVLGPRGTMPGYLYWPQLAPPGTLMTGDIVEGTGSYSGRKLVAVAVGAVGSTAANTGAILFNSTGPWRV